MTTTIAAGNVRAQRVELALTALRAIAGLFLVPHGCTLLFGWFGGGTWAQNSALFESAFGLRPGLAWSLAAGATEVVAGLALAIGVWARLSALAATVLLVVAGAVMSRNGWFWHLRGMEYHAMWAALTATFAWIGPGRYSVDHRRAGAGRSDATTHPNAPAPQRARAPHRRVPQELR